MAHDRQPVAGLGVQAARSAASVNSLATSGAWAAAHAPDQVDVLGRV